MKTAIESLKAAVLFSVLIALAVLTRPAYEVLQEIRAAVVEARRATKSIADYAQVQTEQLRSEKNVKAIDAGIAAAASFQATAKLINTQIAPRAMRTLDSLDASAQSLNALIQNTDREVNARLLPAASADLEEAGKRISELEGVADNVNVSLKDIHTLLGELVPTASSLSLSAKNFELTTAHLEEAARSAPGTAKNIEDVTRSTSKWRKYVLGSQVFSNIVRAVF